MIHIARYGPSGGDISGALAATGGLVLVGLAVAIPVRHRGEGSWRARAVAVPLGLLGTFFVLVPIGMGLAATHKWREPVGEPPSAAYGDVTFKASDGLDLAGWYRPSENGAAVVVVHGGSSDRKGSLDHARMLARHGYGVLVYDARGRGESDGSENNYGWDWDKDVAGALGLSTGADVLIDVVAGRDDVAALVTDGAAAGSFADAQRLGKGGLLNQAPAWLMFTTIGVLSGDPPSPALEDRIAEIEQPSLLISAGTTIERDFNVLYDEAAGGGPVEHWNLPDAHHTDAIHQHAGEYERRVVDFLDRALL